MPEGCFSLQVAQYNCTTLQHAQAPETRFSGLKKPGVIGQTSLGTLPSRSLSTVGP